MEFREKVCIVRQEQIASDVFSMWIDTDNIAKNAKPGQFILRLFQGWFEASAKAD